MYYLGMQKKILIVEDDEAFFNLCATALKLKGYNVVHVADGSQALEVIANEKPDLILLDIVLPGMSGLDILQNIKETEELKGNRVIMLTNFGTDANVNRAMELGAEDYIMKYNVVPSELANKVSVVLGDSVDSAVKFVS
ncbi:MAG: Two-component transcriptional regulator [candidate division WWE3 bacterium GW2011_GWA1_41_8]|uniref:Two-component transcriptional regulator n=2 Tax=Katanobacteria TaxID=422282 RepID=A0A0G0ZKS4_UNCKA|nr:MAG: Two-component transcriptional regulator [candidate division WWE3 bacterium GW2011_GWA1_41_8]